MCTSLCFKTKSRYFGRNLDLEWEFGGKAAITPRGYTFALKNGEPFRTKYAMIGAATVEGGYPLYAEAANEKGLAMAALNFPGNAKFFYPKGGALNLAQYELFPYFLGKYATVEEIMPLFKSLNITSIPFSEGMPPSPLHWMISDGDNSIVVEQTESGLHVYDNNIGVLTNNPPFPYHLSNINNYMNLSPHSDANNFSAQLGLKAYGGGMGAIGLPGDTSSPSRFVRAAFNKWNSVCGDDERCSVTQFFHILDSVSMVSGSTYALDGQCEKTLYSCCINLDTGTYYCKTYDGGGIFAIGLGEKEKNADELTVYEFDKSDDWFSDVSKGR